MIDVKKLRELAEAATPGKRYTRDRLTLVQVLIRTSMTTEKEVAIVYCENPRYDAPDRQRWHDEADFIAALDRETVLALLDRLEAAERVCEALDDADIDTRDKDVEEIRDTWRLIRDGQGGGDGE